MGGPPSVISSDIYMVKMKNDVVIPSKPIFYCRFVTANSPTSVGHTNSSKFIQINLYISNTFKSASNQLNALIRLKKFKNFEE